MINETEDVPFLHHPNIKDDHPRNGLICFLDSARECGPSCMSFINPTPEGKDYIGNQWANCMLLVNVHRIGKHTTINAGALTDLTKVIRRYLHDAKRIAATPSMITTVPPREIG